MRETAKQTAVDLDSLRQEMQKRMESLPEQTAQATAAVRRALTDQIKEIESLTPALTHAVTQNLAPAPLAPMPPAPEPYRPAPQASPPPPRFASAPSFGGTQGELPPMPRFDARGRQVSGAAQDAGELDQVTSSLAHELSGASHQQQSWGNEPEPAYGGAYAAPSQSFGARTVQPAAPAPSAPGAQLQLDEIARAIDAYTAGQVWQRMRAGEPNVLGRHIYTPDGQATFDEVTRRYEREAEFRGSVDRYIGDFERLLGDAELADPSGGILQSYLTSDQGRVYLLLAHASGRLR
jgi:predicted DNA-binding protein